jgi:hypothetical protein
VQSWPELKNPATAIPAAAASKSASLNTTTGSFTPSTSTVGTYVVSYNLPQALGCPGAVSTTTVSEKPREKSIAEIMETK